jgi:group I intron endonuclease
LNRRFSSYFRYSYLRSANTAISKALIKYGHSNFKLEILEYCDPSEILSREQHYLDLLKPYYNILKIAGSSFGRRASKHTDETILKLKAREKSLEHKAKL